MKLSFLGAAQEVTGSNFLLEACGKKIVIDCGMFQGSKDLEELNGRPFDYNVGDIDKVLITHAHIDHIGRLPKMVKDGYDGEVIMTKATMDLAPVMLYDSAKIGMQDAETETKKNLRQGLDPVEPLYTDVDVDETLKLLRGYAYDEEIELFDGIKIIFRDAGHILGSAIIEIYINEDGKEAKLVFSGDLGMPDRPLLKDPTFIKDADYVIMESTYGNRNHEELTDSTQKLIEIIDKTVARGGTVLIPSFAVGRSQELIYLLNKEFEKRKNNNIRVFLDSPMAVDATEVFMRNYDVLDEDTQKLLKSGDDPLMFKHLKYIRETEDSKALNVDEGPKVIIASSGMMTAGRIRHHLKNCLWDKRNSLVIVGYQAEGSLGRIILSGVRRVKLFGQMVDVGLEFYDLQGFSAHADQNMLLKWLDAFDNKPKKVFLVHGESDAQEILKQKIIRDEGLEVYAPKLGETINLATGESARIEVHNNKLAGEEELKKSFDNLLAAFSNTVKSSNKLYTKENLKKSKKLKDALDEAELALVNVNKELNS